MITDAIVCEIDHGINELSKLEEPFDPTSLLYMITCNTTCQLVFGRRYDYDDAQYLEFIRDLNRAFEIGNLAGKNYLFIYLFIHSFISDIYTG